VVTTFATSEKTVVGKEEETNTTERYPGQHAVLVAAADSVSEHEARGTA